MNYLSIPHVIENEKVRLLPFDTSAWPYVSKLSDKECRLILLSNGVLEDNIDLYRPIFRQESEHRSWCKILESASYTSYWIISKESEGIAGYRTAKPFEERAIALSSFVLPDFRNRGFSSESGRVLSGAILRNTPNVTVVAEVAQDNLASVKVLLKAGFTEVASGVCSTGPLGIKDVVRRFAKPVKHPDNFSWPIAAP